MTRYISSEELRELYSTDIEFALIDPREEMLFARAHLFAATNMPLSRLELRIASAVPRRETRIVLCDDGDGVAERAAMRLQELEYENLRILAGGVPAWALSGGAVFAGVNVPSKAFGEFVEKSLGTPAIPAADLAARIDSGKDTLILDARPAGEHAEYCIPGAICCPSAELIFRTAGMRPSNDTRIVVHCAGRTRSIIGAQTLIDAGVHKDVVSLENGTPAWEFAGLDLEEGSQRILPSPGAGDLQAARSIAHGIRSDWQIPEVAWDELSIRRDADRTHYLFDVRSEKEYLSGHVLGAVHVPGGQLLQTTDSHIVVQHAAITLVDSDGIRATTTAMWLRRMGWEDVAVLTIDAAQDGLENGSPSESQGGDPERISISDAAHEISRERVVVCDIRNSVAFRRGHIEGAYYLNRADLATDRSRLQENSAILLMTDDLPYARFVARDLQSLGLRVRLIDGDYESWLEAGYPVSQGIENMLSRPVDIYLDADHFDSRDARARENRAYLNWEVALIDHIADDPAVRFIAG